MNQDYLDRKHPVHLPPVERHNTPVILFVTLGLQPRSPSLADERFRDAFTFACQCANAWSVGRYMIMPDHVHFFCCPAHEPRIGIKTWSSFLKRQITARYGPHDWDWQSDVWDTQIRSGEHYRERWDYIRQNPVRKGWVRLVDEWPWQGELNVLQW